MSDAKQPENHRPAFGRGLAWRIALVGIGSALVAVGIITAGGLGKIMAQWITTGDPGVPSRIDGVPGE